MSKWKITSDRAYEYEVRSGADSTTGWAWDMEREDGKTFRAKVEIADTAAVVRQSRPLADEAEEAIRSKGKSALSFWLGEDELPDRIVIHTHGVSKPQ